jgi:peptide/nickel transport system substrate-binding protein
VAPRAPQPPPPPSEVTDSEAARVVYEPLAAYNPDGDLIPILVEELPSVDNGSLSPDGTAVTWRLKQGVAWHDGQHFTADDVLFTWAYAADPTTTSFLGLGFPRILLPGAACSPTPGTTLDIAPYWALCPGVMIFPAVLSINYIGDGLRDALDPRRML